MASSSWPFFFSKLQSTLDVINGITRRMHIYREHIRRLNVIYGNDAKPAKISPTSAKSSGEIVCEYVRSIMLEFRA